MEGTWPVTAEEGTLTKFQIQIFACHVIACVSCLRVMHHFSSVLDMLVKVLDVV